MAYIRVLNKLPSGIDGWYIYHDVNGKLYISGPNCGNNVFHTLKDTIVLRNILNEAIKYMKHKRIDEKKLYQEWIKELRERSD